MPLALANGTPNHEAVVAHAALTRQSVRIADVYAVAGFDFAAAKRFDAQFGYRTRSLLAVPMQDHRDELIGVLQLVNAQDAQGAAAEFSEADERLAEALTGLAGVVLTNQLLIGQLEALFESLVALINTAIDEKSPYTGGHCQRVPELTMMLAEAAHETTDGALASFRMSERDRAELHLAGMLHDCGKITTPVHVVDKATKLQTIVDRIELVAARFDALCADTRRCALERKLAGADAETTDAKLAAELDAIAADLAFLRRANVGEETMPAADVERVRRIAERRYTGPDGHARPVAHRRRAREPDDPLRHADCRPSARSSTGTSSRRSRCWSHCPGHDTSPACRNTRAVITSAWTARAIRVASRATRCRGRRG